MKVTCMQENLSKGLSIIAKAVASRSSLPVLSNVLLETDGSRLKLSATNLEIGINCWIGAKVEQDGAITVPARILSDFVNSLPKAQINMELQTRTFSLRLKCDKFDASMKGIDAHEFPIISASDEEQPITIDPQVLREMIGQVICAVADNDSRPALSGISIEIADGSITMVAADGYRLATRHLSLPTTVQSSIIVPGAAMKELAKILGDETEPVRIIMPSARKQVYFRMSSVDLISQLIEERFVEYQQLLPKNCATRTVLNCAEFQKAVRLASCFTKDTRNAVHLSVNSEAQKVTVSGESSESGSSTCELEAKVEGEPVEIIFNATYLMDALAGTGSTEVALETKGTMFPGVLTPAGGESPLHLIMPLSNG